MTEISLEKDSTAVEEKQDLEMKKTESEETNVDFTEEKSAKAPTKVQGCPHHLGYLSERSKKEKIPEECMVCENIVQCMLKKVTG